MTLLQLSFELKPSMNRLVCSGVNWSGAFKREPQRAERMQFLTLIKDYSRWLHLLVPPHRFQKECSQVEYLAVSLWLEQNLACTHQCCRKKKLLQFYANLCGQTRLTGFKPFWCGALLSKCSIGPGLICILEHKNTFTHQSKFPQ